MDYRYNTLSDHSLQALLQQHTSLRYEAQLELIEELKNRSVSPEMLEELEATLVVKKQFLESLGFLDEMGFKVENDGVTATITRKFWSQVTELASIIVGAVLVFVGAYGVINLYNYFTIDDGASDLQMLIFNGFFAFLGIKGFQMLGGLPRFINNLGMKFNFSEAGVTLVKRIEFSKETITGKPNEVTIEETEDMLILKLKDEVVMMANPKSFVQRATLDIIIESLTNKTGIAPLKDSEYAM